MSLFSIFVRLVSTFSTRKFCVVSRYTGLGSLIFLFPRPRLLFLSFFPSVWNSLQNQPIGALIGRRTVGSRSSSVGSMHHQSQEAQHLTKTSRRALGNKTKQHDLSNTHHQVQSNRGSNLSNSDKITKQRIIVSHTYLSMILIRRLPLINSLLFYDILTHTSTTRIGGRGGGNNNNRKHRGGGGGGGPGGGGRNDNRSGQNQGKSKEIYADVQKPRSKVDNSWKTQLPLGMYGNRSFNRLFLRPFRLFCFVGRVIN